MGRTGSPRCVHSLTQGGVEKRLGSERWDGSPCPCVLPPPQSQSSALGRSRGCSGASCTGTGAGNTRRGPGSGPAPALPQPRFGSRVQIPSLDGVPTTVPDPPWGDLPPAPGAMSLPSQLGWDTVYPPKSWVLVRGCLLRVLPPTFARWGERFGDPLGCPAHPVPSRECCGVGKEFWGGGLPG